MSFKDQEKFPSLGKKPKKGGKEKAIERISDEEEAMETMDQRNTSFKNDKEGTPTKKVSKSADESIGKREKQEENRVENDLARKILIKCNIPEAEVNAMTKEQIQKKLEKVLGVEETPLKKEKTVSETGFSVKNINEKEFTNKHWNDRTKNLNKNEKINYLKTGAIGRLNAIMSSENATEEERKKAKAQIGKLQKIIGNLENKNINEKTPSKRKKTSEAKKIKPEVFSKEEAGLTKKQWKEAKALYGKLLMGKEGHSEQDVETILNSSTIKPIIENFYRNRQKEQEKDGFERKREQIWKMYDEAVEGQKEKRLKDLRAQMKALFGEALKGQQKDQFEEFKKSIGDVEGKKYNHEAIKDAYLKKLGWKVKYDAFSSKAWLVPLNDEKKFIDKNGSPTDKKKERAEFKTQWRFPEETPFIQFLREQARKKMGGAEIKVESKLSPEENYRKWKEHFSSMAEVQETIEEAEKEAKLDKRTEKQKKEDEKKWEKIHGPSGMVDVWEATYGTEKKKKSFWQKFKEFWTKERKF